MGAVYLAFDTALDNQVAVKTNRSPAANSATQFLREARLLASLHHPHLPRVIDYFTDEDIQFLVMDYIPGRDLDTVIREDGAQPLGLVLKWAKQLGEALSFLHHQNPVIIHRDVKPANVRLTDEGDVVLVDFGIAKVVDVSQATTASASAYTPGYAPPEQYGGAVRTGPYTDQYALAALIYHLLTGDKPADAIQRALSNTELVPISRYVQGIPAHVQAAIERALLLKPTERFPEIDDFIQALIPPEGQPSGVSEATVIEQPDYSQATVLESGARREPSRAQATAASRPLPPLPPPPASTVPPAMQPAAAPKSRRKLSVIVIALLVVACLGVVIASGAAAIFLPRFLAQTSAVPVAAASQTPIPGTPVPAIAASNTIPPATDTPQPPTETATSAPSPTELPTDTPVPSATPLSIGGGGQVLFASNRADGVTFQLWTMQVWLNDVGQAVAGNLKQLTDSPGDKRQPAWSPDGSQIVYSAPGSNGYDLWTMNADGSGEPVAITNKAGDEKDPAWSPDGQWIAFTSDGRSDKVLQLYLVRPDGSGLIRLSTFQDESDPTWSPKMQIGFIMKIAGNRVLYIRGQKDAISGATPTQPYYVTPVFFDFTALHGNLGQVAEPAWSPDGEWVTYTRLRSSGGQIFLAHYPVRQPIEKDILRLTDSNSDSSPAWSPDGQWIIFTSKRDGNSEIYIMRSTGTNQDNLTGDGAEDVDPTWFH